jgi:RNA polymerase sigma-70 factor (ECF subfamily)
MRPQIGLLPTTAAASVDRTGDEGGDNRRALAKRSPPATPPGRRTIPVPTVTSIYEQHAGFVWLTLQRMGVRPPDLGDLAHDVFVIVHRRISSYDRTSRVTTWLFGICRRVAANYRRRHSYKRTDVTDGLRAVDAPLQIAADEMLVRREERVIAEQILAKLSLEKRAVFIMFEIEGLSCQEIADVTGSPIGTVYSRLHGARAQVERALAQASAGVNANK